MGRGGSARCLALLPWPAYDRNVMTLLARPHVVLLAVLSALSAGCGAGRDATEKQLAELRAEVTRLRAAQATLSERLDGLEIERGAFAKGAAPAGTGAAESDRPDLAVVRLSPSEDDGDADSDGPRPVIRAVGGEGSIVKGDAGKAGARGGKKAVAPAPTPSKPGSDNRPTVKP